MSLDARLQAVADLVPFHSQLADIGTDHAYLPIELIQQGKISSAIAADINEGPLWSAQRSIEQAGLSDKIETRLGSGLSVLTPGEVTTVTICGMGGKLMADLLRDSVSVVSSLTNLILQPQQGYATLRRAIYELNWHIIAERLAIVDNRIYQIIHAQPGSAPVPAELELLLGPCIIARRPPLFTELLNEHIAKLTKTVTGMQQSSEAMHSEEYARKSALLTQLEELLCQNAKK